MSSNGMPKSDMDRALSKLQLHAVLLVFPLARRWKGYALGCRIYFCFLHILAWICLGLYSILLEESSGIGSWLLRIRVSINVLILACNLAMPVFRRCELSRAVEDMESVNRTFRTRHARVFRPVWIFSLVFFAALLRLCFSAIKFDNPLRFVFSYFAALYCVLVADQFAIFLTALRSQFGTLKEGLYKASLTSDIQVMGDLCSGYRRLAMAAVGINRTFSVQILFVLLILYVLAMSELFHIFNELIASMQITHRVLLLTKICWSIFPIYLIVYISFQCHSITETANEFNNILSQITVEDKTNEVLSNGKIRYHIFRSPEVVFSACGFFNIDYTLIHSMVASATTYLVILVQFGKVESMSLANDKETSTQL